MNPIFLYVPFSENMANTNPNTAITTPAKRKASLPDSIVMYAARLTKNKTVEIIPNFLLTLSPPHDVNDLKIVHAALCF